MVSVSIPVAACVLFCGNTVDNKVAAVIAVKPSDDAVKKLHDCIDKVAVALGHDSTDVFRALLAKLIEEPEEKQTFDRLLEMAEKLAAKH